MKEYSWDKKPTKEGEEDMCEYKTDRNCSDCPFITCNNHPQFHLALQCAMRRKEPRQNHAKSSQ